MTKRLVSGTILIALITGLITTSSAYAISIFDQVLEEVEDVLEDLTFPEAEPQRPDDLGEREENQERNETQNRVDPRNLDISGIKLYMTSTEVLQTIEELRASQPGLRHRFYRKWAIRL